MVNAAGKSPATAPGTVSRILWHFTGGPKWLAKPERQAVNPKPRRDAYNNLASILRCKELRLGAYKEIVRIILRRVTTVDPKTRRQRVRKNVPVAVSSKPVCCLSDIPAQHLGYHARRYGKFAIGFHRQSVITHGFNPVLYSLHDSSLPRSIHNVLARLSEIDPGPIESAVFDIQSATADHEELTSDICVELDAIEAKATHLEELRDAAQSSLGRLVAFTKTFSPDEFDTVYCEREWRALRPFRFEWRDVAMIVLPRGRAATNYFAHFSRQLAPQLRVPRTIPIVPWEDLVEH